ncbi:MAG: ATP-binding cassette domain-containing protein [Firmicutes bacterium]|nr:ATP-binding cassette domain-containing protein [Bacillota bacterium]
MAHFEIKDLSFSYALGSGKKALDHINLEIEQGEYITVCGKSGSGKTTLLKHLKSVLTPHGVTEGKIYFEGKLLKDITLRDQSAKIGYVMQNPDNQIVTDKVWHELAFGLESLGMDQKTIRLRVAEMASYFGIQGWFHKNVSELSGGQKQLLNLASIMAMQPTVLILDEPTSQLDPIAATDFLNTVRKINLELGTTIIITEHRLEDIFHASDRVVVMEKGRIICDDNPHAVGEYLKETKNEMFAAMPSPVQIYYGVENNLKCPLTVREGRNWLSEVFSGNNPVHTAIDEKEQRGENIGVPAISIKKVWFRYEKTGQDILKGVDFYVSRGEFFAIVGGNGTGKSTTLKAICNICKPYRGQILIDGKRVEKYKSFELFKGNLAMLPQDPQSIFVKQTVGEDLAEMMDKDCADKETKIAEIAKICDIEELLESHPYDLSGGEQQRAALAKVLLTEPKILLLDEPTKGLDNFFKLKLAEVLKTLKSKGVTILMVSHDVEFCAKYVDKVGMFFDGGLITVNTPNKFFSRNSFYTTAANRMSRHLFENAINNEDVIKLCQMNL